jgi:hypothetical protein
MARNIVVSEFFFLGNICFFAERLDMPKTVRQGHDYCSIWASGSDEWLGQQAGALAQQSTLGVVYLAT